MTNNNAVSTGLILLAPAVIICIQYISLKFKRYTTVSSTASINDYTTSTETITFTPGGSTASTFQIPITDDNFVEASEEFRVVLQLQDAVNTVIGTVGVTTVTINDNDSEY